MYHILTLSKNISGPLCSSEDVVIFSLVFHIFMPSLLCVVHFLVTEDLSHVGWFRMLTL